MSRCFPFPSGDFSRKDASQVESIKKLHSESVNAKHSNGKIREIKENKENSREEKNKKQSRQQNKLDYSVQKKKKLGHDRESELLESFRDCKKDSFDQLERSGVTEEEGLPSSVLNNPCNSLESTQSSSRKNKLLVAQVKSKDQGRLAAAEATDFISSSCGDGEGDGFCRLEMGKCFSDLVLNWNPSSLQLYDLNPGFQDWLFAPQPARRQSPQGNENAVSCKAGKPDHSRGGLISANSLQPQSCYLPEFDIYQLPYVIPF